MKLLYKIIFSLSLCGVTISCSDTEPETPEVLPPESPVIFWEQSHLAIIGWTGKVNEVKETSYLSSEDDGSGDEDDEISSTQWKFDEMGHLAYYNPTGLEPTALSRGIWQDFAAYFYEYDELGRLEKAIVDDFSGTLVKYELAYGEHSRYVPLVFPLGAFDFFLVKGLESITCTTDGEDVTMTYRYTGNEASYSTESWTGLTTTVYEYTGDEVYPARKAVTVSHNDAIVNQETTSYTYNSDGSLLRTDTSVKEGETETERTIKRYLAGSLQITSQKTDAGGQTFDWEYTYDKNNCWISASYVQDKGTEDEMTANETSVYSGADNNGNWIKAVQKQNSLLNPVHADGTVKVCRDISYY